MLKDEINLPDIKASLQTAFLSRKVDCLVIPLDKTVAFRFSLDNYIHYEMDYPSVLAEISQLALVEHIKRTFLRVLSCQEDGNEPAKGVKIGRA